MRALRTALSSVRGESDARPVFPDKTSQSPSDGERVSFATTRDFPSGGSISGGSLVLVFGYLDTMADHVNGHSGWAVDMAKIMHKPLYVFDLRHEVWCWWNAEDKQFQDQNHMSERWLQPPTLQDKTAIVGPRENTPPGFMIEIERLFSPFARIA